MSASPTTWQVILPVKGLSQAKSRLAAPDHVRTELALAMARDTLAAVDSCEVVQQTWLLTSDPAVVEELATSEMGILHEAPYRSSNALNVAVAEAVAHLRGSDGDARVAVVVADLPALRPDELTAALTIAAEHEGAFVPDSDDIGTTAVMLQPDSRAMPTFGPESSERHLAAKMIAIEAGPGLRHDVDTLAALEVAEQMGVGPHTAAVIERRLR